MKQLKSSIVVACAMAAVALLPQTVSAQKNPRLGVWTLDLAASTFEQGAAPAKETRTILATNNGGIQMTGDAVLPSGTKRPTGYRATYDGSDHPYSGVTGDTIALSGDDWAWDATIKMAGKVTQRTHGAVSKDGGTMTLTSKTASGQAISTRVYHKQK